VHFRGELRLLGSLSRSVQLRIGVSSSPESVWLCVHQVVNNFLLLKAAVGIHEIWLVEWLILVVSVPVLSSNDVSVQIILSLPRRLIEQLSICLEPTRYRTLSVALLH